MNRLILALLLAACCASMGAERDGVVVLANRNVPESLALAAEYVALREIPTNRIIALDLPTNEAISRDFYDLKLRDPLLERLRALQLIRQTQRELKSVQRHESAWRTVESSVKYLVSMYGVPLRIADTSLWLVEHLERRLNSGPITDGAAVDSELALALAESYPLKGVVHNPLSRQARWADLGAQTNTLLLAARLDGPDPATVRRMMADAVWAEKYGLLGRAYFDLRAEQDDDYLMGDRWLFSAWGQFAQAGFDLSLDRQNSLFGPLYPMTDACIYFGWYTEQVVGPFLDTLFKFNRGAVAYHLHSGNAKTLRSKEAHWVGPLLARGACVSVGTVDEPFLGQTVDVGAFAERLLAGNNFAESVYMALPSLSWQTTVVGDPLYAPFRLSLEEQIRNMERDGLREVEWGYLRVLNLLVREGRFNVALEYAREKIKSTESLVLQERLGDLLAMNDLASDAVQSYEIVLTRTEDPRVALRVGMRCAAVQRALGEQKKTAAMLAALRARWPDEPHIKLLAETIQP